MKLRLSWVASLSEVAGGWLVGMAAVLSVADSRLGPNITVAEGGEAPSPKVGTRLAAVATVLATALASAMDIVLAE